MYRILRTISLPMERIFFSIKGGISSKLASENLTVSSVYLQRNLALLSITPTKMKVNCKSKKLLSVFPIYLNIDNWNIFCSKCLTKESEEPPSF